MTENTRDECSIFMDAMNDGSLGPIFMEADKFKVHIEDNIETIAQIYGEGNEFCLTGKEPTWLIELFIIHGFAYKEQ